MNKKILSIAAVLLLALSGCAEQPMQVKPTENPNLTVGILFEVDGCTVYRFKDAGHYIYFAKCVEPATGKVSSSAFSSYTVSCGKNCYEDVGYITSTSEGDK